MIETSCIWLRISALLISQFLICSHAAPLPPQQITCPDGKIYALVNATEADREPYVHVKTSAVSLSDCIHTCFGNEFCFSLRYDESEADNCTLYYFSAYNCSRFPLLLAEDIEYTGHAMTIDCIRCPSLGELVSTSLPQTNDEKLDGTERGRIEGFTKLTEGGKVPPNATVTEGNDDGTWRHAHAIINVHEEGAKKEEVKEEGKHEENEVKEMESKDEVVVQKPVDETTHEEKKTTEAESATTVEEKLEQHATETPKENEGEGASGKPEAENKEVTPCLGEGSSCAAPWTLTTTPTSGETAETVKEEATKESETATAGTEEQKVEESTGKSEVSEAPKEESKEETKGTEEGQKPEEKQEETSAKEEEKTTTAGIEEKAEGTEVTKAVEHSIDEGKTTAEKTEAFSVKSHGAAYYERTCVATFEVDPYADISTFEATRTRKVQGPDHCALICYTDACSAAVYEPPVAAGQPGHCKMRFDGHEKCNNTLRRDYYVKTEKSIYLQCFRCLPEKPVTEPTETATKETTAKSETPKAEEVKPEGQEEKPGEVESEKKQEETANDEAHKEGTKAEEHAEEGEKAIEVTTKESAPEEGAATTPETAATEGGEARREETVSGEGAATTSEAAATEGGRREETVSGEGAATTSEAAATEGGEARKEETASGEGAVTTSEAAATEGGEAKKEETASAEGVAATSEAATTQSSEANKEEATTKEAAAATSEAAATEGGEAKKEETASAEGAATTSEAAATEGGEAKKEEPQQEGTSLPLASSEGVKPEQQLEQPVQPESTAGSFAHSIDNPPTEVKTEESESSVKAAEEKPEEHGQATVSGGVSSEGTPEAAETATQGWRLVTTASETTQTEEKKPENVEPEEGSKPEQEKKSEEEKAGEEKKLGEGKAEEEKKSEEGSKVEQAKETQEEEKIEGERKTVEEKKGETGEQKQHEEEKKSEEKVTVPREGEKPAKPVGESVDDQIKRLRVGFSRGCIVTFQADPISQRPSVYGSGFEASTKTRSAEVCAGRCYQDGCTGARYDPQTGDCILGYGGRQNCNNGPEHFFYKPNQTVWIHCTSCRLHKPGDEGVDIMVDLARVKAEQQKTTTQQPEPEKEVEVTQAPVKQEESKTEEAKTELEKDSGLTTTPAPEAAEGERTTEGEQSTKAEVKPTESEEPRKIDEEKPAEKDDSKEGHDKAEKKPEKEPEEEQAQHSTKAPEGNGCVVWFQADPIAQRPKSFISEFEVKNDTATADMCANRCYQDGCTGARYDPETMECALGYGDHQYCSDDQQYDRFRTNETIWIHCITCKEPLPDDRQFELLVDESEETTKFPEGVLPRRGPLTNSVPLEFTTLSSVESTKEISGESTAHETASTTAEEELTTSAEPPLQAVSDLVDALSQNTKLEEILGLTSTATPREESSISSKITDENFSIDEPVTESEKDIAMPMSHVDITNLESTQSRSVPLTHQPFIHEGTAVGCPGRLEFQRMSVTALPKLNVTNDVPARTPADCARKCFETEGCSLAGYIPSPTGDPTNGVCVLTSDDELCLDTKNFVPQHASLSPFVLSCIKCSPCKYTISTVTPERKLPQFEHSEQLLTIGKCAEECSKRKCTAAKYNTNTKICSISSTERSGKECPHETAVKTDGVLPLLLECVECAS